MAAVRRVSFAVSLRSMRRIAEQCPHSSMHHEVGVAADGGGEVQVGRRGEAEVADVGGVVGRLAHRPEEQHVQHRFWGWIGEPLRGRPTASSGPGRLRCRTCSRARRTSSRTSSSLASSGGPWTRKMVGHVPAGRATWRPSRWRGASALRSSWYALATPGSLVRFCTSTGAPGSRGRARPSPRAGRSRGRRGACAGPAGGARGPRRRCRSSRIASASALRLGSAVKPRARATPP